MLPNKWKGNGSGIGVITWGSLIFYQMIIKYSLELCTQISVIKIHFIKSNFFWSIDILVVNRHECIFKKYIYLYYLLEKKIGNLVNGLECQRSNCGVWGICWEFMAWSVNESETWQVAMHCGKSPCTVASLILIHHKFRPLLTSLQLDILGIVLFFVPIPLFRRKPCLKRLSLVL